MHIAWASFCNVKVIDGTMKNKDTDWVKIDMKGRKPFSVYGLWKISDLSMKE